MPGQRGKPLDVLVVVPKQARDPLIRDNRFNNLGAGFYLPYYMAYLKFCRKLGVEINLSRKGLPIPDGDGFTMLRPNENPSHTAMLLATLLDHHHFSFHVIDPPLGFPFSARREFIRQLKRKPGILAVSTTYIISTETANGLIKLARRHSPRTRIMIGGQFLLTSRKSMDEIKGADVFVIGECEDNLAPLVEALLGGDLHALRSIKGIVFREGDDWIHNPPSPPVDLEQSLPIKWQLAKNLFPPRKDLSGYIMIEDGRGCAFQCAYCSYRRNFAYRLKSVDKVIRELKAIPRQSKVTNVFFASSAFTFPPERALEIARRLRRENLPLRYGAYGRVQDIDETLVKELRSADFYWLFLGLESMNAAVLRLIKKRSTPEQIEKAVRLCVQAGIITDCSFIVGLPGESRESAGKIAEFLQNPHVGRYCLFPVADQDTSDLAHRPERYGFHRSDSLNWTHSRMSSREIPCLMADIIRKANGAGHAYSTIIIDTLVGNEISSDPLTAVPHERVQPFYLLMETGTILYLENLLWHKRIDRTKLEAIADKVKRDYLPRLSLGTRIREFLKISLMIQALKAIRFYILRKDKQDKTCG